MSEAILPGATLGVLGSGQLGRMFAIAARRMGYRVHVLSPDSDTPTGQVADVEIEAEYHNLDAVAEFAHKVAVVTFEFENVPLETVQAVERFAPVRPAGNVLHTTQNRLREKTFLQQAGFPTTHFADIRSEADLEHLPQELFPGILKTAAWGYDGKGQAKVDNLAQLRRLWLTDFQRQEAILEQLVDFELEMSVVAARGLDGQTVAYGPLENIHAHHILDITLCPGRIDPRIGREALEMAEAILTHLGVVGVLCVEMFLTREGRILVNELAPRPHNSGHLTIDSHVTCQFEQQVRAVCGLPLGSAEQLRPAAMANLLGDVWKSGTPDWAAALADPAVKLHLYGKRDAKPGRKMGHLTATAATIDAASEFVRHARHAATRG
ncbi:MAG: 5-(carboxyamino)imidazole ribonucleotide synthase [Planctomycetaceae bacterium]